MVFGPAIDGGFYLVGASRLHSVMFQASISRYHCATVVVHASARCCILLEKLFIAEKFALVQGIAWSTSNVLSESISQAASVGLNVAPCSTLPVLRDIDTIEVRSWLLEALNRR